MEGEAYADIVWRQYRKNRPAVRMLVVLGVLVLIAILAPALASDQPFWFREGGRILFPWFVTLVNQESAIDLVFNLALVILLPWLFGAWILDRAARRAQIPGRRRILLTVLLFAGELATIATVFSMMLYEAAWVRILARVVLAGAAGATALGVARGMVRRFGQTPSRLGLALLPFAILMLVTAVTGLPGNKYFGREFKKDQFHGKGTGVYPPIPYGPFEIDLELVFKEPLVTKPAATSRIRETQIHLLGTDDLGRDILVRLLYGTRISLTIGVVAVSIYVSIGIVIGALAGYFGGWVDILISRLIEIVLLFPSFFLILTLVAYMGPSLYMIMVVIGLTSWPTTARLMRGEYLKQRSIDYVPAARALGASSPRVMFRHILPNALAPIFVSVPFGIAGAIVTEAGLSVLGFGARPPSPSWGAILSLSFSNYEKWWLTTFAGLAIFLTMTVFNVVGNGLRDAMDPRLKGTS
jgi:peptide/nickel transport system permease protein